MGHDWPQADEKFKRFPSKISNDDDQKELSEVEVQTRDILDEIGIDKNLLESHIERGPRSHVIGAFRIAQNKYVH